MSAAQVLVGRAAALAMQQVMSLSRMPDVFDQGDHALIVLDDQAQDQVAAFIVRQLDAAPGPIRIAGVAGVVLKVIARKYWGYLVGTLGAGMGLGALIRTK